MLFTAINSGLAVWNFMLNRFVWLSGKVMLSSEVCPPSERFGTWHPNDERVEHSYHVVVVNRGAPAWFVNVQIVGRTESGKEIKAFFGSKEMPIPLMANQPVTFVYIRATFLAKTTPQPKPEPITGHILLCNGDKVMMKIRIPQWDK